MKGDLHPVALRLSQQLPCRTIQREQPERTAPDEKPKIRKMPAKVCNGRGQGGLNRRGVIVQGIEYRTVAEAGKALKIGQRRLYAMLETGKAQYGK